MTDDPTRSEPGPTEPLPAYDPGPTQPIPAAPDAVPAQAAGFSAPPAPVAPSGGSRVRWAIGLGVAGLAVVVAIGAYLLLAGQPTPEALRYIPGDAAMVIEIRPELPGDQLQKVGNLLSHFPGFDDQATLTDKIDEAVSRLVGSAGV
ncbi:MAG: hypothetical protein L0227_06115, partial [Chloroflexi bacterium]|nr:hypothetical protein [Chloroflexota bacterium]